MSHKSSTNITERIKRKISVTIILTLLVDLLFIYLSKYTRKNISLSEFNPYTVGNILNFLFFIIPASGLIILAFKSSSHESRHFRVLLWFAVLMNIPLIISLFQNKFIPILPQNYMLGYPFPKIFLAGLFSGFQFILFMLASAIWLYILGSGRFVVIKSIIYSILLIFLSVNSVLLYNSYYHDETYNYYTTDKQSDVAVVLGAAVWSKNRPSPIFASRIAKASNLYNSGAVDKIQVTGGNAPGERSEADVAYNYLRRIGVPARDIWIERKTASTAEQVEFIKAKLVKEKKLRSIIIVSDRFHLKRVMEICKFYNIETDGVASELTLNWQRALFYKFRDSMALLIFWFFAL